MEATDDVSTENERQSKAVAEFKEQIFNNKEALEKIKDVMTHNFWQRHNSDQPPSV